MIYRSIIIYYCFSNLFKWGISVWNIHLYFLNDKITINLIIILINFWRRQYQGYQQSTSTASVTAEQNRYSGKVSLMEAENRRNSDQQQQHRNNHHSNQLYSPSPARKGADSSLSCQKGSDTTSGMIIKIVLHTNKYR